MGSQNYEFQGWLGLDKNAAKGQMKWDKFEPKPFEETDVDIEISHCGICGSDIHVLRAGWGPTPYRKFPLWSPWLEWDLLTAHKHAASATRSSEKPSALAAKPSVVSRSATALV